MIPKRPRRRRNTSLLQFLIFFESKIYYCTVEGKNLDTIKVFMIMVEKPIKNFIR